MLRLVPLSERPSEAVVRAGLRLRAAREVLAVPQQDMARACGAEPQRWSNWEGGRHLPDPLVMARAMALYGISLDWVYAGRLGGMKFGLAAPLARAVPELVADEMPQDPPAARRAAV